jgi:hypothetical protein
MNQFVFSKFYSKSPEFEPLIQHELSKREHQRKSFLEIAERMVQVRIEKFESIHSIRKKISKAAKSGISNLEIPIHKTFRFHCDLSSPYIRLFDKSTNVEFCVSHNQFLDTLEDYLFREDQLNGSIVIETDGRTNLSDFIKIELNWERIHPEPVVFDFIWNHHVSIDDFSENETFEDLFERQGYFPRDQTTMVIEIESNVIHLQVARKIRFDEKVAKYSGSKLKVRPMNFQDEGIDL